ncbi:GCD complex subunit gcd7 [Microbotryomycetes sp. JL221]|nr:GCD complex subunit gcd7 [Microbotryomycetes sp. JL221]
MDGETSSSTMNETNLLTTMQQQDQVSKPNMHKRVEALSLRLRRRQLIGSRQVALEVIKLLREIVSGAKFTSFKQLIAHLDQVGQILQDSGPKELVITNMTRRIIMLISEEYQTALTNYLHDNINNGSGFQTPTTTTTMTPPFGSSMTTMLPASTTGVDGGLSSPGLFGDRDSAVRNGGGGALGSLFELLGHKPAGANAVTITSSTNGSPFGGGTGTASPTSAGSSPQHRPSLSVRTSSSFFGSTPTTTGNLSTQPNFITLQIQQTLEDEFTKKSFGLKPVFIEAIQELMDEVELTYQTIGQQAVDHIHSGEFILTIGQSNTVEAFLKAAARKRKFTVIVAETAPSFSGRQTAENLSKHGINTILIPDQNIFALLPRCSKVVLGPHLILADGTLLSIVGSLPLSLAANRMRVPVVVVSGMFKFSNVYLGEADWGMRDLGTPEHVLKSGETCLRISMGSGFNNHGDEDEDEDDQDADTEVLNPYYDVVPADLVNLYITNLGGHPSSLLYRLLSETYGSVVANQE